MSSAESCSGHLNQARAKRIHCRKGANFDLFNKSGKTCKSKHVKRHEREKRPALNPDQKKKERDYQTTKAFN